MAEVVRPQKLSSANRILPCVAGKHRAHVDERLWRPLSSQGRGAAAGRGRRAGKARGQQRRAAPGPAASRPSFHAARLPGMWAAPFAWMSAQAAY